MSTTSQGSKPSSGWKPPSLEEMQAMLPQYHFESLIGRGGMGAVYRAVQISLDRPVAIKVLPGDLMDDADVNFTERFKNEARTMAKMNHPGIVNVFDFGEAAGGLLYIVMEFVDGTDVAKMISTQGRLPSEHALAITAHVCDALAYAHRHGIIHRDIKPANIMVNMEGAVKVADFGLAKANDANQSGLTKTNMAMGTPDFVAPEALIAGMTVDGRADLYAIGVMLYQMLTGNIPRGMWTMPSIMVQTDPRFDAIISRAMQTDREARYQDAGDIRRELDVILTVPMVKDTAPSRQESAPAQKPVSKGPPKPHHSASHAHHTHAPPAKKTNFGMIAGIAATVMLGGGLYWLFSGKNETTVPVSSVVSAPLPAATSATPPAPEKAPKAIKPDEVHTFDGHRYQLFMEKLPWQDARVKAQELGGHLATLNSQAEYEWMMKNIIPIAGEKFFLGAIRTDRNTASWEWITSEPFTSQSWMGDFNNDQHGKSHVLSMDKTGLDDVIYDFRPSAYLVEWSPDMPPPASSPVQPRPAPAPGTINLLAGLDVEKNKLSGDWQLVNGELVSDTNTADSEITLPVADVPPEYDVRYHLTRFNGFQMQFRFGTGQRSANFVTDGAASRDNSKEVQVKWGGPNSGVIVKPTPLLRDGKPHELVMQVRAEHITVLLDGQEVLRRDVSDVTANDMDGFSLKVARGKVIYHAIEIIPVNAAAPKALSPTPLAMPASAPVSKPVTGPVNLLENLDTTRQALAGRWFMQSGALLVDASNVTTTAFEFEHLAPEEYDYEIEFSSVSTAPDVIQILPAPGAHWFLVRHNWQTGALIGNYLDGVVGNDPARTQGVARQFKIAEGRRYKSVVKVRRDSVQVELDGMPIITWRGELSRLSTQGDLKMRDVRHPGLSTVGADMIIHKAEIRPPSDEKSKAASEDHPALANARVKQLTSGFKSRLDSDALNPYREALAKLNQSYITNGIAKARAAAQSRGDLATVNALDEEKTLLEKGGEVPEVDSVDAPAALAGLRATYRGALQKIRSDRDEKAAPLYDIYLRALDAQTDELTRANKIDEARQVKSLRDEAAAQRPQTAVASVNKSPAKAGSGTTATTIVPAKAAASGGSPWRTAANFLLSNGGSFVYLNNGTPTQVLKADDIPAGKFDIIEMALDRAGSLLPPLTMEQMKALNGLRDLRRVWVRPNAPGIADQAFAFLAGNDDLNWINLEGVPDVTDAVLPFLAEARKLDCLYIQYATKFTGIGLDKMTFVNSVTRLDVLGCGITDEGMQAISAYKKLLYLRITSTALTDACGPHLGKLKTLADVSLNGTGVSDGTCGFIATLTDLTALDLGNTKVTSVGLQKLKTLRKLASLSLANTAVTLQEAAAFQEAMPQCRVTR